MNTQERLKTVQQAVTAMFPSLLTQMVSFEDQIFLHAWKYSSTGLKYLPNFHLIFELNGTQSTSVKLLSYSGKILDSISFNDEASIKSEGVLSKDILHFISEFLDITDNVCQGFKLQTNTHLNLIELMEGQIIGRSINCTFKPEHPGQSCKSCQIEPMKNLKHENLDIGQEPFVKIEESNYDDDDNFMVYEDDLLEDEVIQPSKCRSKKDPDQAKRKRGRPRKDEEADFVVSDDESSEDSDSDYESEMSKKPKGRPQKSDHDTPKKKRGRPKKMDDSGPKIKRPVGRPPNLAKVAQPKAQNRAPRVRTEEDQQVIQHDQSQGYRGTCTICLRSFTSQVYQKEDMANHLKHFSVDGKIACPLCKIEVDKVTLTLHFDEVHHPQTSCVVCLEVFEHKEGLKNHIFKSHHVKPKCPHCHKNFYSAYSLGVHIEAIHKKAINVFCHQCGKGFAHRDLLRNHLRTACGTQDWKCPLCSKTFETKPKVQCHLKVHCTERPYVCPLCSYRTYKANNMLLHSRKVHRLKGCKNDFFVDDESLQRQKSFLQEYLKLTTPLAKTDGNSKGE